ncbi:MAG: hypothetical protein QG670_2733 [Thermoproteota archaeon]|nr:hypothetical protein [Thermoproteota archaeon]
MELDTKLVSEGGVRALAQTAIKNETSKKEVLEAIRVEYCIYGVDVLYTASKDWKELSKGFSFISDFFIKMD